MTYSVDLRARVVEFVRDGGSKSEAVRIFGVSRPAIYSWLRTKDLTPKQKGISRRRKLDWAALEADVKAHPDLMLRERARRFGVQHHAIWYALRQMEIRRKKTFRYFQGLLHNRNKRRRFLKLWYKHYAAGKTFVYVDETGFAHSAERQYGYAPRGEKVYGLRSGNRRPRTSLIAARIGRGLATPMLFEGTCNTAVFNTWLARELCPILTQNMVVIMDNATFHKSAATRELIHTTGAELLFLPPYSPDLNPIENTFGTLKKNRSNYPDRSLNDIINMYENYLN